MTKSTLAPWSVYTQLSRRQTPSSLSSNKSSSDLVSVLLTLQKEPSGTQEDSEEDSDAHSPPPSRGEWVVTVGSGDGEGVRGQHSTGGRLQTEGFSQGGRGDVGLRQFEVYLGRGAGTWWGLKAAVMYWWNIFQIMCHFSGHVSESVSALPLPPAKRSDVPRRAKGKWLAQLNNSQLLNYG